jgi:hypothetical protein
MVTLRLCAGAAPPPEGPVSHEEWAEHLARRLKDEHEWGALSIYVSGFSEMLSTAQRRRLKPIADVAEQNVPGSPEGLAGTLPPGSVRTVFVVPCGGARRYVAVHTLLLAGEAAAPPGGEGRPQVRQWQEGLEPELTVAADGVSGTRLASHDGLWAANRFLHTQGADGFSRLPVVVGGAIPGELSGPSAGAALALATVSAALELRIPSDLLPIATVHEQNGRLLLGEVGRDELIEKLAALPAGVRAVLAEGHRQFVLDNEVALRRRWEEFDSSCGAPRKEREILYVGSFDDLVASAFPGFLFLSGREKPVGSSLQATTRLPADGTRQVISDHGLVAAVVGLLLLAGWEVGFMQEYLPPSSHSGPRPEWPGPFLASLAGAALLAFAGWLRIRLGQHRARVGRTVPLSVTAVWVVLSALSAWWLLSMYAGFVDARTLIIGRGQGSITVLSGERHGWFQVLKALFFLSLLEVLVVVPALDNRAIARVLRGSRRFFALRVLACARPLHWLRRGALDFPVSPSPFGTDSGSVAIICTQFALVIGALQWASWRNPVEVGFGDGFRALHMVVQAVLLILLAASGWWALYDARRPGR